MSVRIGSLCTGYGGLDMAVQEVFGGTVAWHCQYEPPDKTGREDKNQYAAQILAHHWPEIPNHGDLTTIDFRRIEPVHILTAGFPCQDVSLAGLRAGLAKGTRSGLWLHVARAVEELQPGLVVIENVRGLLSAPADGDVEPCTWCVGDAGDEPLLRALGAVLADLARLGFDAEWQVVRASDVGAPHQRERCFLLAWPADTQGPGCPGAGLRGPTAERAATAADAHRVGGERDRTRRGRRHESASHGLAAAHAPRVGEREPADEAVAVAGGGDAREVPGGRGGASAANADRVPVREQSVAFSERVGTAVAGLSRPNAPADDCPTCLCLKSEHDPDGLCNGCLHCVDPELGQPGQCPDDCPVCARESASDAARRGRTHGPVRDHGLQLLTEPRTGRGTGERRDTKGIDRPGEGATIVGWGEYEPAIRRWEHVLGRPAPRPTDALGRLSPAFVEWMQGLPAGHVTGVPGLPRGAQLRALGNGVVSQQAAAAIRLLADRAGAAA